jgi:hypothetical protein
MQSGWHTLATINGADQKDGAKFKARNSSFTANSKTVAFSTDIAGAYQENAKVKSWIRSYTLTRGKSFSIKDKFALSESVPNTTTSSNLITYCKVSEIKPGLLKFEGNGFVLSMSYNAKSVRPVIEFKEITDRSLKRYWPDGVTRVRMEYIKPGLTGESEFVFKPEALK